MTPAQITADVDRGLALVAQIEAAKDELKNLSSRLEQAALEGDQIPLTDDQRDGMQFLARGTAATVPVIITADLITGSFADGSPAHARIEAAAKGRIKQFYTPTTTWKLACPDGKALRREAAAVLGDDAPAFVSSCLSRTAAGIPKNQIKIHWDRATTP